MASPKKQFSEVTELVEKLNNDRSWILIQLDNGKWPEIRKELAELERKISKLIISVQEYNIDS